MCRSTIGGVVGVKSPMGKGSMSESGKKRGKGEAEEGRKQPGNNPSQKMVLKRSNIVSTSSCQC
jgi:hypothetical protein